MKRKLLISAFGAVMGFITAKKPAAQRQNVKIPDQAFKACLIRDTAINTSGDTEISVTEAQAFTGTIRCGSKNISDLTGIEAFVNITALYCFNNQLSSLDISNNTALERLDCRNNQLSSLDASDNTALSSLYCHNNQLSSLDTSNNTALAVLGCASNRLSSLNLKNGNNINMYYINLSDNPDLRCVQVDDVAYSNENWPDSKYAETYHDRGHYYRKDVEAYFSENCR